MTLHRAAIAMLLCLSVAACAMLDGRKTDASPPGADPDREILVMLRMPPPHFRPDAVYAGGYASTPGRLGRQQIANDLARQNGLTLVTAWPMPALGLDCFVMRVGGNDAPSEVAERVARDSRVESAQAMQHFDVLEHNDPLYALQPAGPPWHLDDVHRITTGRNVRVAVVDTGIELDHPDLRGQIVLHRNLVDGSPYTAEPHGTAVASIIAANADDRVGIAGVAPGARLLALRACWQLAGNNAERGAACNTFTLAKALQAALEQDANVINMSLGGPPDRLLARLLDAALARGITVVAAVQPARADGGFPASHPGVLAVGAESDAAGPVDALWAPGRDIPSAAPVHAWRFVSGASFAAAHVTGIVALLLEARPATTPREMHAVLASAHASTRTAGGHFGVDACAAIARTRGTCACSCAVAHEAGAAPPR